MSPSPSEPRPFEPIETQVSRRAGLRVPPPDGQPTGVFALVEMTVLVVVAAMAMAAIIVSAAESEHRPPTGTNASRLAHADDGAFANRSRAEDGRRDHVRDLSR